MVHFCKLVSLRTFASSASLRYLFSGLGSMKDLELTHLIIGAAIEIHRNLGPGLLESYTKSVLRRSSLSAVFPMNDKSRSADL